MNALNLPAGYQPYAILRVGENVFENTMALVTIGGQAPLLIGKGEVPRVWVSVPGAQPGSDWLALIVDNVSSLPELTVDSKPKLVKVSKGEDTLCNATVPDIDTLVIHNLDLRPLGLDIFFDSAPDGFHAMGSDLIKNKFCDVPVALRKI